MLASEIIRSLPDSLDWMVLFDPSAFAILSLAALGRRDRTLLLAQLRLMDYMEPDGTFPPGTPFYSAWAGEDGGPHEISSYFDGHRALSTSAATLALLTNGPPATAEEFKPTGRRRGEGHPRYWYRDHVEYVRRFAIPSYTHDW